MENEFYRHYKDRVMPALRERHKYKNVHQIPRVAKVVVNTSVGSQADLKQAMEEAKTELALITGQQPAETRAKKSIANFKLRKDQIIGAKVTLRGDRMYEFLERLIKRHTKKSQDNPQGKIAEREGPIHISNVKLIEQKEKPAKAKKKKEPAKAKA